MKPAAAAGAGPEQHTAEPRDEALAASSPSCSPTAQPSNFHPAPQARAPNSGEEKDAQKEPGHCGDQLLLQW